MEHLYETTSEMTWLTCSSQVPFIVGSVADRAKIKAIQLTFAASPLST